MPLEYAHQFNRPAPNPWKEIPSEKLTLSGPIGISTLPDQHQKKVTKRPFVLNIMLVGQSGLGKTTLFNTIFDKELLLKQERSFEERKESKFSMDSFELEEEGVRVTVNVYETAELGVHVKKEDGIAPIVGFLEGRLQTYMDDMAAPKRDLNKPDPRMHVCLYFIPPSGHGISELDMALISKIHHRVNLIPVVAKADSFTPDEVVKCKKMILASIQEQELQVYPLSLEQTVKVDGYPFAVIGSESSYQVGDQKVRGRKFKWGVAQVDNPDHCDFTKLRDLLIKDGFDDLKEKTDLIFEEFRRSRLEASGVRDAIMESDDNFQEKLAAERAAWEEKVRREEEEFQLKYKKRMEEKEEELKKREAEIQAKRDSITKEIDNKKAVIKIEEEEVENQLADAEGEGEEGEKKEKKRSKLSGISKSLRRK